MDLKDKDLGKEVSDRTKQIAKVINRVNDIEFSYDDAQFDVLGTAYMILIGLFASDSGKRVVSSLPRVLFQNFAVNLLLSV